MIAWSHIVIHHSLTEDGQTVSWGAIRKYHTDPAGPYKMQDIGYHVGIELIGDHHEILIGRELNTIGAHCTNAGMNRKAIGICVVGNFDAEVPSVGSWNKALEIVRVMMDLFKIPKENIIGHREAGLMDGLDWQKKEFKSCPGSLWNMDAFRANF
jgi:hypothetical protein